MTRTSADRVLRSAVSAALEEDRYTQDRTSRVLRIGGAQITARVTAQGRGVLSGIAPARAAAARAHISVVRALRDGATLRAGEEVLLLRGPASRILGIERTVLNYLMHLSGVASATARAVRAVRGADPPLEIWGTRKTLPGLRDLEKSAIAHGGGRPHRRDLASGVLVKGTHLSLVPLAEALQRVRPARASGSGVQVEVRTTAEALAAARAGIDRLLIDNASPARARQIVRALERAGLREHRWVELSGGITPENAARYRRVGADALSLGALTHSAPALPFHLEILTVGRPSR